MKKVAHQHIARKPLMALAIIFFGIGIAMYTNMNYKEGNENMNSSEEKKTPPAAAAPAPAAEKKPAPAAAPATPAFDIQSMLNPETIQKLLNSPIVNNIIKSGSAN